MKNANHKTRQTLTNSEIAVPKKGNPLVNNFSLILSTITYPFSCCCSLAGIVVTFALRALVTAATAAAGGTPTQERHAHISGFKLKYVGKRRRILHRSGVDKDSLDHTKISQRLFYS